MVEEGDSCPTMFGQVWVRDPNSLLWAKAYLLLKERKLYLSYKVSVREWNLLILKFAGNVNFCVRGCG